MSSPSESDVQEYAPLANTQGWHEVNQFDSLRLYDCAVHLHGQPFEDSARCFNLKRSLERSIIANLDSAKSSIPEEIDSRQTEQQRT